MSKVAPSPAAASGDAGGGSPPSSAAAADLRDYLSGRAPGLVFSGWYSDRVYSEQLFGYRDRIRADESEAEAGKVLRGAARKAKKVDGGGIFSGVERSGDTWHLLVDWSSREQQPFGHYWFFVEGVRQGPRTLHWDVRILRPVLQGDEASSGRCPHCGKSAHEDPSSSSANADASASEDPLSLSDIANNLQKSFRETIRPGEILSDIRPHLTFTNLLNALRFILVLIMALVSGTANLLPKMWQLLNKTLHEGGFFLRQAMPFLLACVEVVNKVFGGVFLLIAMVWRDLRSGNSGRDGGPPPPAQLEMFGGNRPPPPSASSYQGSAYQRTLQSGGTFPYRRENVQRPYFGSNR